LVAKFLYVPSRTHRFGEAFKGLEIALLNELDRCLVLQMFVRCIEKDAGALLVTAVKFHDGYSNPIQATKFRLEAAGVGVLANARSLLADSHSNR
jgi:hypothetical protein